MIRHRRRLPILWCAAGAIVAAAALAPTAFGLASPAPVKTTASSPSYAASWAMSWSAVPPDAPLGAVTYEGGLRGGGARDFGTATSATVNPDTGSSTFRVRAVQTVLGTPGATRSDWAEYEVRRATISGSRSPDANPRGWSNSSVVVSFACSAGVVSCTGPQTYGQGVFLPAVGTGRAADGSTAQASVGGLAIDLTPPVPGSPVSPRNGEVSGSRRPLLDWSPGSDPLSGLQFYEVWLEAPYSARLGATSPGTSHLTPSSDLPVGPVRWYVKTFDRAYSFVVPGGPNNGSRSGSYALTIDPSAPPPPGLSGPQGPTNDSTPTFGWTGAGPRFEWLVTRAGQTVPVVQGATTERAATVAPALADGAYTLRVKQIKATGIGSPQAVRDFTVDTVAPGAPTITERPEATTTLASPLFAWRGDPGSTFTWRVAKQSGGVEKGPVTTGAARVAAGPLGPGGYEFGVRQQDAAGNSGPWSASAAFSVVGGVAPVIAKRASGKLLPLTRNAKRLRPGPGARVQRLRPILRWRAHKAAEIYNLQVFEVRGKRVKKVLSVFPNRSAYKIPANKLKWTRRYAWRVWPYLGGKGYSRTPIGISYFDVTKSKPGV